MSQCANTELRHQDPDLDVKIHSFMNVQNPGDFLDDLILSLGMTHVIILLSNEVPQFIFTGGDWGDFRSIDEHVPCSGTQLRLKHLFLV